MFCSQPAVSVIRAHVALKHAGIVKGMFGGNFGSVLSSQCGAALSHLNPETMGQIQAAARVLCFKRIQFYEKCLPQGGAPQKYMCSYSYDRFTANSTRRNIKCSNRCGSTAVVKGMDGREGGNAIIRIQVCFLHMHVLAACCLYIAPLIAPRTAVLHHPTGDFYI